MDKSTFSNYGWIVVMMLVISMMVGLATPFAAAIKDSFIGVTNKFTTDAHQALNGVDEGGSGGSGGSGGDQPGGEITFGYTVSAPTSKRSDKPTYIDAPNFNVYGSVSDASKVTSLMVNGEVVTALADGSFSSLLSNVAPNALTTVTIVITTNEKAYTETRYLYYDNAAPVLTVGAPSGASADAPTYTTNNAYTVSGTASDGSGIKSVTVNGTKTNVNGDSWSATITLTPNATTLVTVVATDNAGKTTTEERYVRYDDEDPVLNLETSFGTSADAPTYFLNGSCEVKGNVGDAEEIKSLTVNGTEVSIGADGNWSATVTLPADTVTAIEIVVTDKSDRTVSSVGYAYYDSTEPNLEISTTLGSSVDAPIYTSDNPYTVSGSVADANGIKSITVNGVEVSVNEAGEWSADVTLTGNTTETITIVATDNAGRTSTAEGYVRYDGTAPEITMTLPLGTSADAPAYVTDSTLTITGNVTDDDGIKNLTVNGTPVTIDGNGDWAADITLEADKLTTITIVATDNAGKLTTLVGHVFYDNRNPSLIVDGVDGMTSDAPAYVTNSALTVNGTVSDASGIKSLTINGTDVTVNGDGSWNTTITLTANTVTEIVIVATDNAGRTASETRYACYSNEGPTLAITTPTGNAESNPTYITTNSCVISGTASAAGGIKNLTVNGATVTVNADESWSFTLSDIESNKVTEVVVIATDSLDRTTTKTRYVFYDNTNPILTVTSPAGTDANEPSFSVNDTYTVGGTATDEGGIKKLTINGVEVSVSDGGSWNTQISLKADTVTAVTVVATDNSGKTATETRYVCYDSTAPELIVTAPTGTTSGAPTYSNTASYTVSGKVADVSGIKSLTVNGTGVTVNGNGSWSTTITLTANTVTEIVIVATDNAGKTASETRYACYSSEGPTLTIAAPAGNAENNPTYINANSCVISGTASAASGIKNLTVNGTAVTVNNDDSWSTTLSGLTSDSLTTITVVATDNLDRTSTEIRYVFYDGSNPELTVTLPTGTSSDAPSFTVNNSYTVAGTATDEGGIKSVTVNGVEVAISDSGSWDTSITLEPNTVATVTIVATDNSGKTATETRYVCRDTDAPIITVNAPTGTTSGAPTYSNAASYTVSGKVTDMSGIKSLTVNGTDVTVNGDDSWSITITLNTDVVTTVGIIATDMSGKTSSETRYVCYDVSAPSLTVSAPAGITSEAPTYTANGTYTVSGTVSDASGIKSVTVNGSAATVSGSNWSKSITLEANRVTTVTVVATDNAGRTTTVTRYVYCDTAAPALTVTTPTGTSTSAPAYTTSNSYTVSGTASATSGIKSVTVNGTAVTVGNDGKWSYTVNNLVANNSTTITVVATDNVGKTTTITRYVNYDSVVPSLTVSAPTGTSGSAPTYVTSNSYTVKGTASDSNGLKSVTVNGIAVTVAGDGSWSTTLALSANTTTTVTVVATDNAGRTTTITRYVRYDDNNPSLTVSTPAGTTSGAPTYTANGTYTVSGTVSDVSGIKSVTVNGSAATVSGSNWSKAITLEANKVTTITVVATDNAGKTATVTKYVYYDTTAPTLTVAAPAGTSTGAPTYTTSNSYIVSGTASDTSGIKSVTVDGTAVTVGNNGTWSHTVSGLGANTATAITVVATDNVGETTTIIRYVNYDNSVPSLTVTAPADTSSSAPTYVSANTYTVSGNATDGNGIKALTVNGTAVAVAGDGSWSTKLTLSVHATTTVTVIATDNADRTSIITRYVRYDSANPSLTVSAPTGSSTSAPTYTASSTYEVKGTVSDGSGIKSVTVNGSAATVSGGNWSKSITLEANKVTTVTVIATDNAGKTATVTKYVYYDTTAPTLAVSAPSGTSTSAPTYSTSSSYAVSGTASDTSGIKSVTVNGNAATISGSSWSYTMTGLTAHTVTKITVVATDNVGKTTTITRYVNYDSAVPSLTVSAPTGTSSGAPTYVSADTYTVSGNATDGNGLKSVTVNGAAVTVAGDGSWSTKLTLSVHATTTVTVVATDNAGRTTTVTRYVYFDSGNPSLTVSTPSGSSSSAPTYTASGTYEVKGTVSDGSGIKSVTVNGSAATISNGTWSHTITGLTAHTATKITVIATDNVGKTTTITRYVNYDSATPSLTVSAPTGTASATPTYVTSASYTVKGTASDGNGLKSVTVNGTAVTVAGDGSWSTTLTLGANTTTTVTVVATDNAGRTSTITRYVRYDNTNPSLAVSAPSGSSSSAPTYTASGTYEVKGTASDASGIKSVTVNGSAATVSGGNWSKSITLEANKATTVTVVATDNAGKTTTVTKYVYYDNTAPTLAVSAPSGTSTSAPTYSTSSSYTVKGTASDTSGIKSVTVNGNAATISGGSWSYTVTGLTAHTATKITVVATDNVGKTTTITRYVNYDSAVPSLTVTAPTGTSSSAPTYVTSSSYTVSGTVSDANGIKSVTVNGAAVTVNNGSWSKALTLSANTAITVTVVATDNAGRTTTVTRYVYYDNANPTLNVSAPTGTSSMSPTVVTNSNYTVSGTVSDASGIKSVTVNGTAVTVSNGSWSRALSLGANTTTTVTVVATDNAGRTTTVTRYVRYNANITFYIDDIAHTALIGSTWEEWSNSDDCPYEIGWDSEDDIYIDADNWISDDNGDFVDYYDVIVAGANYYSAEGIPITFYLDDNLHYAVVGSTWEEWGDSEYCPYALNYHLNYGLVSIGYDNYISDELFNYVNFTDTIVEGVFYYTNDYAGLMTIYLEDSPYPAPVDITWVDWIDSGLCPFEVFYDADGYVRTEDGTYLTYNGDYYVCCTDPVEEEMNYWFSDDDEYLITFYIDDEVYDAVEGSTWEDWSCSDYCPYGMNCDANGNAYFDHNNLYDWILYDDGNHVNIGDWIDEGACYYTDSYLNS